MVGQSVGTFTLVKNEMAWIEAHLKSWLPHVDEMVFFDGNSTDGTLEVLRRYANEGKVKLYEDKDPKDLKGDYQRLFNECLRSLSTNYAIFAHPDMILEDPGNIRSLGDSIAYTMGIRSFAGDPGGQLYEIIEGRGSRWKNIYRLRNPDLGLVYHGDYGSIDEDCYFRQITGDEYKIHWANGMMDMDAFPYCIKDSGIKALHYSDVRTKARRIDRMVKCLLNQGWSRKDAVKEAENHPRVIFVENGRFSFKPAEYHHLLSGVAK